MPVSHQQRPSAALWRLRTRPRVASKMFAGVGAEGGAGAGPALVPGSPPVRLSAERSQRRTTMAAIMAARTIMQARITQNPTTWLTRVTTLSLLEVAITAAARTTVAAARTMAAATTTAEHMRAAAAT